MYRLVAAAVVALAAVGETAGLGASPREHHIPLPPPEGKLGQNYCTPIVANLRTKLRDDAVGQNLMQKGYVRTSDSFSTSKGPARAVIRLFSFKIENLDGVKRLGAGVLDMANNTLDCALKFSDLKITTKYRIVIPRSRMIPPIRNYGSLSLNAIVSFDFSAVVDSDGLLDELKSISLRNKIAVSNFNAPRVTRNRYSSILTGILRNTMDSAVAKIMSDMVNRDLEEILPNLTLETP